MSEWPFHGLQMFGYNLILADNPWPFSLYSDKGNEKSASAYYETMTMQDIAALPVGQLARGDCLLMMWCTGAVLPDAINVMKAWGFQYKSEMVWRKTTVNGKVRLGTGYRVRSCHEPILLGTIGNPKHKPFPSLFDGLAREHSRKPESIYALCEKHMPDATKLDLFSRERRSGWDNFGYESDRFNAEETVSKRERETPEPEELAPMPLFDTAA